MPRSGLVSVIIPTCRRPALLRDAIRSVQAQTYRPIELVVVSDGIDSETAAAVKEFAEDGDRFTIRFIQQERQGAVAARQRGLDTSSGEFVQFLDDDDTLHPQKLATAVVAMGGGDADAVVTQAIWCDEQLRPTAPAATLGARRGDDMVRFFLRLGNDMAIHAPLYRRDVLHRIGGWDPRVRHGHEVDLHLRLAIAGARFTFLTDRLVYIRAHDQPGRQTTVERLTPADAERDFYSRIIDFAESRAGGQRDDALREHIAGRIFGIARRHYACGRTELGHGCLIAAREICPGFSPLRLRLYTAAPLGGWIGATAEYCGDLVDRGRRKVARLLCPRRVA